MALAKIPKPRSLEELMPHGGVKLAGRILGALSHPSLQGEPARRVRAQVVGVRQGEHVDVVGNDRA